MYNNQTYDEQYGVGHFKERKQLLSDTLHRLLLDGLDLDQVHRALYRAVLGKQNATLRAHVLDELREDIDEAAKIKRNLEKYLGKAKKFLKAQPHWTGATKTIERINELLSDPFLSGPGIAGIISSAQSEQFFVPYEVLNLLPPGEAKNVISANRRIPGEIVALLASGRPLDEEHPPLRLRLRREKGGRPRHGWIDRAYQELSDAGVSNLEDRRLLFMAVGLIPYCQ
jgi:hypothetical protein